MDQVALEIALPADVAALLGETDEQRDRRAREALVLHLLREGDISQSQVADLLDITIHDVIDLMARYDIPAGPRSVEELLREVEAVERVLRNQSARRERN
jgi:predicted HTH domain antitoxin